MDNILEEQKPPEIFFKEEVPSEPFEPEDETNRNIMNWCEVEMKIKSETEDQFKFTNISKNRKDFDLYSGIPIKTKNKQHQDKIDIYCDLCEFKTKFPCNLKKHKTTVHDKVKNMCPFCNKEFLYLKEHIDTVHLKNKLFACKDCDFSTVRLGCMRRHMKTHETRAKQTCPICFIKSYNVDKHVKKVHEDPVQIKSDFQCPQCPYKGTKVNLNSHVLNVHEVTFTHCTVCNKEVNTRKLNSHMKKHQANQFSCNPCNKTFRVSRDLARHVLYYHKKHRNTCEYCGKDVTSLKQHVKWMHKEVEAAVDDSEDLNMMNNIKAFLGESVSYNGELDIVTGGDQELNTWEGDAYEEDPLGENSEDSSKDQYSNEDTNPMNNLDADIKLEHY
eukprot:TRINITY_DN67181_c0_g1_i1.p1 TRINITY_DN67181_c0_g1~~TRINITY_DN67181_c0_g1_i1.p1  ORF type:complete len:387 (-),score=79.94 TRINITY_DN67181_c0_g1_i1:106-1266(-)